jgi:hypothetical protein
MLRPEKRTPLYLSWLNRQIPLGLICSVILGIGWILLYKNPDSNLIADYVLGVAFSYTFCTTLGMCIQHEWLTRHLRKQDQETNDQPS